MSLAQLPVGTSKKAQNANVKEILSSEETRKGPQNFTILTLYCTILIPGV